MLQRGADAIGRLIAKLKGVKSGEALQWAGNARKLYGELVTAYRGMMNAEAKGQSGEARYSESENEHTAKELQIMKEYNEAVDEKLLKFVENATENPKNNMLSYKLSDVSPRFADDINRITGINASNFGNEIRVGTVTHIENRHGSKKGMADKSMTHDDIARIQYVIDNYDNIEGINEASSEFRDKNQRPAPMVRLSKRIDGTYYIAEAVPDTKKRTLEVVSAYKEKAADNQTKDVKTPPFNVRNASDATASTDSIYQNSDNVNSFSEKNNNISSNESGEVKLSLPKNKGGISREDIEAVQSIGRKSVNDFDSEGIKKTEGFARQYYKEMGVKSPFFRAWFGDWRVGDTTPVHVVTEKGSESGVFKNKDTGWDIQVSGKVFNETKSHNAMKNINAKLFVDYVDAIAENSVLLNSFCIGERKSENSLMMHSMYALSLNKEGGVDVLKMLVEEIYNPNGTNTIKRSYQLQDIAQVNKKPLNSLEFSRNKNDLAPAEQRFTYTVSDLFDFVKQNDKSFNPKPVKGEVNEDGTPKEINHSGETVYIRNDTKQMKSTDNIGTFDKNNADIRYSLPKKTDRKYWHTDLTKSQIDKLQKKIDNDIKTSENTVTDKANWISTYIGKTKVFAIYSTVDTENPTILYEVKGKRADVEEAVLKEFLGSFENGEYISGASDAVNQILGGNRMFEGNGVAYSNDALGRGGSNRNAKVLQG